MKKITLVLGLSLLCQACTTYAISPSLSKQAENIPFSQLDSNPQLYKGKLVLLGGTIVLTTHTNEGTLIEAVQKGLDRWGKPLRTDNSEGRFIVRHAGYLDAFVYAPGRDITVAAVVDGSLRSGIAPEDTGYQYPLVQSRELKLWADERESWKRPQYMDPLRYDPHAPANQY